MVRVASPSKGGFDRTFCWAAHPLRYRPGPCPPPAAGALPVRSGRLLAKDVTVVHARLGEGLQLKGPVLIRGGHARVSEPASHRAETPCRRSEFSHWLSARQVPCETVVQTAVQKSL